MHYDDYQSLVKLYKNNTRLLRYNFLERKYRRLKKKGHPRKYLRIRKYNKYKTILFDVNPFESFSSKREKWKTYFKSWYALAYLMRRQILTWSALKMWKYFHGKSSLLKSFTIKSSRYKLMKAFYEQVMMPWYYKMVYNNISNHVSRTRNFKLKKFIKKYIKSLAWEVDLKKKKFRFKKNKKKYNSVLQSDKNLAKIKPLIFINKEKYINRLRNAMFFTYKSIYNKKNKSSFNIKELEKVVMSITLNRRIFINSVKKHISLRSAGYRTFKKLFKISSINKIKSNNLWSSLLLDKNVYSSFTSSSLRYVLISLLDLTNNGKLRQAEMCSNLLKSVSRTVSIKSKNVHKKKPKRAGVLRNKVGLKKYNSFKNRKVALSKLYHYLRDKPRVQRILRRYVNMLKKNLIVQILRYKQLKPQLNVYEKYISKQRIFKLIKSWRRSRKKLRKMVRSFDRSKQLTGTLKSWFIIRYTSQYRKLLIRLRKYFSPISPVLKKYPSWSSYNPLFTNYLFFVVYLYIMRTNAFYNYHRKSELLQMILLYCYINRNNVNFTLPRVASVTDWMRVNSSYIIHQLLYY